MISEENRKNKKKTPVEYRCEVCGKNYDPEQAGNIRYTCCGHRISEVGEKKFPPPTGP